MRSFLFYIFLSITLIGTASYAQTAPMVPNGGAAGIPQLEEQVSYDLLPLRPNQGDTVEIEAKMYGTPVKNAIFTWVVDGKLYSKEQGLNTISVYWSANFS